MSAINPFDAADLTHYVEANHILNWYARLTPVMRQRCVDTILDLTSAVEFIGQATQHLEHSPGDFNSDALDDFRERVEQRVVRERLL